MPSYNLKIINYAHSTKFVRYSKPVEYDMKQPEAFPDGTGDVPDDEDGTSPASLSDAARAFRTKEMEEHSMKVSLNRTKNAIYDLAKSNDWEWFATFTFDPKRYDSTDYDAVVKLLKRFIDNVRKNYAPDLVYLIVPELHADGRKFHFHGLLSGTGCMDFAPSGIPDSDGEMIYNVLQWKYGFSSATQIKDTVRASAYVTKYITKDCVQHTKHKRRYLASRNIKRPAVEKLNTEHDVQDICGIYHPGFLNSVDVVPAHRKVTFMEVDD